MKLNLRSYSEIDLGDEGILTLTGVVWHIGNSNPGQDGKEPNSHYVTTTWIPGVNSEKGRWVYCDDNAKKTYCVPEKENWQFPKDDKQASALFYTRTSDHENGSKRKIC